MTAFETEMLVTLKEPFSNIRFYHPELMPGMNGLTLNEIMSLAYATGREDESFWFFQSSRERNAKTVKEVMREWEAIVARGKV